MNEYVAGSMQVIELVFLQQAASSDGAGFTGLLWNGPGLICSYKRSNDSASVPVVLRSIGQLGQWVSGGFQQIDPVGLPGCYEFHVPDAAWFGGSREVTFFFSGVAGLAPRPLKFTILPVNAFESDDSPESSPSVGVIGGGSGGGVAGGSQSLTDLQTRQSALTAEIAAGPTKPTYSVNGQQVSWIEYRRWLYDELTENLKAQQMLQPFELRTIAL